MIRAAHGLLLFVDGADPDDADALLEREATAFRLADALRLWVQYATGGKGK